MFNFRLLFAPANYLEIVYEIRDFPDDRLKFWLFIKKIRCNYLKNMPKRNTEYNHVLQTATFLDNISTTK